MVKIILRRLKYLDRPFPLCYTVFRIGLGGHWNGWGMGQYDKAHDWSEP